MKKIILSTKGGVGKSMIAREIYHNTQHYEFETLNTSNSAFDINIVTLQNLKQLALTVFSEDDMILDVGNSDAIEVLDILEDEKIVDEFDKFIIPSFNKRTIYEDTSKLIQMMIQEFNINASKIYVLLNNVDANFTDTEKWENLAKTHNFNFDKNIFIPSSEIIDYLDEEKLMLKTLIDDKTDFKTEIKAADKDEKMRLWEKRKFLSVASELKQIFINVENFIKG